MPTTPATWTVLSLLRWTAGYFADKGVPEPRASAEILLAYTLGVSRLDLYLRHDQPLTPEELARFKALILRRRLGEPVAYLTGHKEFWSLDFFVTPATLIPRPETEVLVEAVLDVCGGGGQGFLQAGKPVLPTPAPSPTPPPPTPYDFLDPKKEGPAAPLSSESFAGVGRGVWGEGGGPQVPRPSPQPDLAIDIGVGSGAVVVVLARELPDLHWLGVDLSAAALRVARENARRHEVAERISFFQGDLLAGLRPGPWFSLIVANLPYVSQAEWEQLPGELRDYEPPEALLGGEDGLDLIRPLSRQAHEFLQARGWLALEVGAGQAERVVKLLDETKAYDTLKTVNDLQGIPRVVLVRRRGVA